MLKQLCGLRLRPAGRIARLLIDYFHAFTPIKTVTTAMTMSNMLKQFQFSSQLTDCMLPKEGWTGLGPQPADSHSLVPLNLHPDCQQRELGEPCCKFCITPTIT